MGGSHGGSANGVGGSVVPGGGDIETWGEDIDDRSVVGEIGNFVSDSAGSDGDSGGGTSGAGTIGIGGGVSSSDGDVNAASSQLKKSNS